MPVDLTDFEEPFFEKKTLNSLEEMSKAENVCGIKIWKNLGLELKRKNGQYAKMTDPEFEVVFEFAKDKKLPVVMHVADPPLFLRKSIIPMKDMRNSKNIRCGAITEKQRRGFLN